MTQLNTNYGFSMIVKNVFFHRYKLTGSTSKRCPRVSHVWRPSAESMSENQNAQIFVMGVLKVVGCFKSRRHMLTEKAD